MRRGIGVAHVQQKKKQDVTMADLGACMTAERIALLADQLDDLKARLKHLTSTHLDEIQHDAIVRGQFRKLAESLGVDFASVVEAAVSEANAKSGSSSGGGGGVKRSLATTLFQPVDRVLSDALGLTQGQRQLRIACDAVECCIRERQYAGNLVPVDHVVRSLRRTYHSVVGDAELASSVSEESVREALSKLSPLASGYQCVCVDGVWLVQSVAGDAQSAHDQVTLLNAVAAHHRAKIGTTSTAPSRTVGTKVSDSALTPALSLSTRARDPPAATLTTTAAGILRGTRLSVPSTRPAGGLDPTAANPSREAGMTTSATAGSSNEGGDSLLTAVPSMSLKEVRAALPSWAPHRVAAAVNRLLQEGAVWMDNNTPPSSTCATNAVPRDRSEIAHDDVVLWFVLGFLGGGFT